MYLLAYLLPVTFKIMLKYFTHLENVAYRAEVLHYEIREASDFD